MADNLPPNPAPPQPANTAKADSQPGALSRLKLWLGDSYNGLFKIVIQPQLPSMRLTIFMVMAFLFGMIWAYAIAPATYYNGSFDQLGESNRNLYVKLVAATYQEGVFASENQQNIYVGLLNAIEDPSGTVNALLQAEGDTNLRRKLEQIKPVADQADGTPAPKPGSIVSDILTFVIAVVIFLVIVNVFALLWGLLIGGYVMRFWERIRPKSEEDIAKNEAAKKMIEDIKRRKALEEEMHKTVATATSSLGPPITQRISTYTKGRSYDDSFAIEDANDMFLGECGASIAKTISDSQELTAVEIWLFDKEDFVRTFTKLFVSRHAFNDPVIRAELEPKVENPQTDLVILEPGAIIILDSKEIRVEAKVVDVTPGTMAGLPPDSHFAALTLQMQAWERKGEVAAATPPPPLPAPAGGQRPLDSYEVGPPPAMPSGMAAAPPSSGQRPLDSYEIGPPPPMPSGMTTPPPAPPSSGQRPLESYEIGPPPPMPPNMTPPRPAPSMPGQSASPPEDDLFGGSGDFTPLPKN